MADNGGTLAALAELPLPTPLIYKPPPTKAALIDLEALKGNKRPQGFYVRSAGMDQLADACAVVQDVRLPLHSQVLSHECSVLRELFLVPIEGAGGTKQVGVLWFDWA
jgi:hypothetical protein